VANELRQPGSACQVEPSPLAAGLDGARTKQLIGGHLDGEAAQRSGGDIFALPIAALPLRL
jgi:hypothetical protein